MGRGESDQQSYAAAHTARPGRVKEMRLLVDHFLLADTPSTPSSVAPTSDLASVPRVRPERCALIVMRVRCVMDL